MGTRFNPRVAKVSEIFEKVRKFEGISRFCPKRPQSLGENVQSPQPFERMLGSVAFAAVPRLVQYSVVLCVFRVSASPFVLYIPPSPGNRRQTPWDPGESKESYSPLFFETPLTLRNPGRTISSNA